MSPRLPSSLRKRRPIKRRRYRPRYTVGSVTGYSIANGGGQQGRKEITFAYVYDRLYCYRPVAQFSGPHAEALARQVARRRNEEEREWQRSIGWLQ